MKPGPENPMELPPSIVLVKVADLEMVMRFVPSWPPCCGPNKDVWIEATQAQRRLRAVIDAAT